MADKTSNRTASKPKTHSTVSEKETGIASTDANEPLLADNQRIDKAHHSHAKVEEVFKPSTEDQAAELAELLYHRQTDLDKREAKLHAHMAEFECKQRTSRMWLEARQEDISEREEALEDSVASTDTERKKLIPEQHSNQPCFNQTEPKVSVLDAAHEAEASRIAMQNNEAVARRAAEMTAKEETIAKQEATLAQAISDAELCRIELDQQATVLEQEHQGFKQEKQRAEQCLKDADSREQALDERQARLYVDLEKMTAETVRLADKQHAIDVRKAELDEREDELSGLQDRLKNETSRVEKRRQQADYAEQQVTAFLSEQEEQEEDLAARETQLAFRSQEIQTALKRFEKLGVTETRMRELREEANALEARRAFLDQAERLFEEEQNEFVESKQELGPLRALLDQETERTRRELINERSAWEAERIRRQRRMEEQERSLDQQAATLEQLKAELAVSQREVFEMRLATEEIYSQLSGSLAPASLARSIAQTREKLADHYQLQEGEIAQQGRELEQTRVEMSTQHAELLRQRDELDAWLRKRQQEIEQQAARLVAREQELDRQDRHTAEQAMKWNEERQEYKVEIRRLLASLRRPEQMAA